MDSALLSVEVADVLGDVRRKGVRLWVENGALRYEAPKGVLTAEDIARLRQSRRQIVALLEPATDPEAAGPTYRCAADRRTVPLTYSQLSHWHWYRLGERRHCRQIASATRIRGPLDWEALRGSFAQILRRQEALRTRMVIVDGQPAQQILEPVACEIQFEDLTAIAEADRDGEVRRRVEQYILEPIDLMEGPLWAAWLQRVGSHEHVLIVVMEHLISDAASMSIFLRELFTAYLQAVSGTPFDLPEIPVQFRDYALWQRNTERRRIERQQAYWSERLAGAQRVRFPTDRDLPEGITGWQTVAIRIQGDLKAELEGWCRHRAVTPAMGVFTAYAAVVLRWCNVSDVVIRYVTDGRLSRQVEHTIGFFASLMFPRIELRRHDSLADLLRRAQEEYCRALEHVDHGYIDAQLPKPQFTRNCAFNWIPAADKTVANGSRSPITWSPIAFEHPLINMLERDTEPVLLLQDMGSEITGDIHFPRSRFSTATMERFARNLEAFIQALIRQSERPVQDLLLL